MYMDVYISSTKRKNVGEWIRMPTYPKVIDDVLEEICTDSNDNCVVTKFKTKFNLNKLAFEHKHTVPFKNSETLAPNNDDIRFTDKVLKNTKFKLPHWIYNLIHQHYEKKHDELSYIYKKDKSKVKNHIVFLGFDYGFRGNSRYLFNHFAKYNSW